MKVFTMRQPRGSRWRTPVCGLLFACLASGGVVRPVFAQAPPPTAARAAEAGGHFKRGIELYGEADYTAALIEFRRAYEIDPKFQALYNIGETYFQLQDYANALQTLEKYLRDGGAQVPAQRRDDVQKEIEKLKNRVASLEITVKMGDTPLPPGSQSDVDVAIDDIVLGKSALSAPIVVSAGRRRVTVTKPNHAPVTQIVELAAGDVKRITLSIADDSAGPVPPPVTPPVTPVTPVAAARVPAAPWVITGILAAGAIVTGSLALGASSETKSAIATYPNADPNTISSDHSKTFALGVTTDCLIGAAAVAAAISIYFTVAANSSNKRDSQAATLVPRLGPSRAPAGSTFSVQAGPESIRVRGTF